MTFRRVAHPIRPSSHTVSVVGRWFAVFWFLLNFTLVGVVISRPSSPTDGWFTLFWSVFVSWVSLAVLVGILIVSYQLQAGRERARGYTWARDKYVNLDQVEPRTLLVIREAGEPFLAESNRKAISEQARAWDKGNRVSQ